MTDTTPTSPSTRSAALGVLLTIGALLAVGWISFALASALVDTGPTGATLGIGLATTAFLLGVRHAFDADHIAAIDNTSRKLVADGRDASSVGLWFALGHSTIVVSAVVLVTVGLNALTTQIGDDDSPLAAFTGAWGPTVSSVFLLIMAGANAAILFRLLRSRTSDRADNGHHSEGGGVVFAALTRASAVIDAPWKMFVVGLLFGLGFDTASTITLLLLAGGAGVALPLYAALTLPLLFTAGMVMCDGINSIVTHRVYSWSTEGDRRRVRYNAALLSLSILVASLVGIVGLAGVLVDAAGMRWQPLVVVAATDLDTFGFVIVGAILTVWAVSWLASRRRPASPAE